MGVVSIINRATASNVAAFLVCFWHESEMPTASRNVRVRGQSGKHVLVLSSSQFDPEQTSNRTSNFPKCVSKGCSLNPRRRTCDGASSSHLLAARRSRGRLRRARRKERK